MQYILPPLRVMSAVNKTGKWDPVWVRISPHKPATMNPEVALTASRRHLWWRTVAEGISWFRQIKSRLGCTPTQGDAWSRWTHRGAGGHWGRSGENRRLGGDKSELLRHYITTSQRGGGPALMTLWWMADSGSIKIYGDGSQRAGNRTLAPARKLLARGGFKGKEHHHAGTETCWCGWKEAVGCTGAFCLLPIRCLTCGIPRRMDVSCKARPTRAIFLFS